ncbi:hypothetical protein HMPREF9336_01739 [Segniliparus rugosus ATCC BAA-974]|uniref:Phage integrase family protein n=2 Tax=Segniliparus rugosus TaxID=286804 RepID=E5XQG7_SEGRC|nr:hypothetical protein HMPREF9336_01739 [Segniliparus rugosus ATCC BAA-974]
MHMHGVKTADITAWLGHANPYVTMKIYTHTTEGAAERVAESYGKVVTFRDNEPLTRPRPASGERKAG